MRCERRFESRSDCRLIDRAFAVDRIDEVAVQSCRLPNVVIRFRLLDHSRSGSGRLLRRVAPTIGPQAA
jgi:hypothetical protein